jgi:hypothetical protein
MVACSLVAAALRHGWDSVDRPGLEPGTLRFQEDDTQWYEPVHSRC